MPASTADTPRMVVTKDFDVPQQVLWEAWTTPSLVQQWWGPNGFTSPACRIDLRVGGRFLLCMRTPEGQDLWTGGIYHQIVPHEKIALSMYFADADGKEVNPEHYGIEHHAARDQHDLVTFTPLPGNRTRLTFTGNESQQDADASGQTEGWRQMLEKLARQLSLPTQP